MLQQASLSGFFSSGKQFAQYEMGGQFSCLRRPQSVESVALQAGGAEGAKKSGYFTSWDRECYRGM